MADFHSPVVIGELPSTGTGLSDRMAALVEPVAFNGNVYCGQKASRRAGAFPMKFYPLCHPTLLRFLSETFARSCHKNYGVAMKPYLPDVVAFATQQCPMSVPYKFVSTAYGCARVSIEPDGCMSVVVAGMELMPRFLPVAMQQLHPLSCRDLHTLVATHTLHCKASRPFASLRDYLAYLWLVGNCVVEPCSAPRVLVLLGLGDTGKSRVLEGPHSWLGIDCATILSKDSMLERKPMALDPDDSVEAKACSHRYAYHGDVTFTEDNPLDFGMIKALTREDPVDMFGIPAKPRCLIAFG